MSQMENNQGIENGIKNCTIRFTNRQDLMRVSIFLSLIFFLFHLFLKNEQHLPLKVKINLKLE